MVSVKRMARQQAAGDNNEVAAPSNEINTDIISGMVDEGETTLELRKGDPTHQVSTADKLDMGKSSDRAKLSSSLNKDVHSRKGGLTGLVRVITKFSDDAKERITENMSSLQSVSQILAEASDLYSEGESKAKEAAEAANRAAISLYKLAVDGKITQEIISERLRDTFGAKLKGSPDVRVIASDPQASKTPFGYGEDIRKRIVRACRAYDCYVGEEEAAGTFFEGLSEDSDDKDGRTLRDVVEALDQGKLSIWTAYEAFAAIKRNHMERLEAAFDFRKISAIVQSLTADDAGEKITSNPSLMGAYKALFEVLGVIEEEELQEAAE